jgi:hypothetical protein
MRCEIFTKVIRHEPEYLMNIIDESDENFIFRSFFRTRGTVQKVSRAIRYVMGYLCQYVIEMISFFFHYKIIIIILKKIINIVDFVWFHIYI